MSYAKVKNVGSFRGSPHKHIPLIYRFKKTEEEWTEPQVLTHDDTANWPDGYSSVKYGTSVDSLNYHGRKDGGDGTYNLNFY